MGRLFGKKEPMTDVPALPAIEVKPSMENKDEGPKVILAEQVIIEQLDSINVSLAKLLHLFEEELKK